MENKYDIQTKCTFEYQIILIIIKWKWYLKNLDFPVTVNDKVTLNWNKAGSINKVKEKTHQ